MKTLGIVLAVLLFSEVFSVTQARQATPAPQPCERLSAYQDAILDATRSYSAFYRAEGLADRDSFTFSVPEWTALAEHLEAAQAALKRIQPPAWVADWHLSQIEVFGFRSIQARAAAATDFLSNQTLVSGNTGNRLAEREEAALMEAIAACPEFAATVERWDALDRSHDIFITMVVQTASTPEP